MSSSIMRRFHAEYPFINPVDSEIARQLLSPDGCHRDQLGDLARLRAARAPASTMFLGAYRWLLSHGWMLDRHLDNSSQYVLVFDPVRCVGERHWQQWCHATEYFPWRGLADADRLTFDDVARLDPTTADLCLAAARAASSNGTTWVREQDVLNDVRRTVTLRHYADTLWHLDYPERVLQVLRTTDEDIVEIASALAGSWTGTLTGLLDTAIALQGYERPASTP